MIKRWKFLVGGTLVLATISSGLVMANGNDQPNPMPKSHAVKAVQATPTNKTQETTTQPVENAPAAPVASKTATATTTTTPTVSIADQNKDKINALINARAAAMGLYSAPDNNQARCLDMLITNNVGWDNYDAIIAYRPVNLFLYQETRSDGSIGYTYSDGVCQQIYMVKAAS